MISVNFPQFERFSSAVGAVNQSQPDDGALAGIISGILNLPFWLQHEAMLKLGY
jgi:hypothetical protein